MIDRNARGAMPRTLNSKSCIALLDELRQLQELAEESGVPQLQRRLLTVRRSVLRLVQQQLLLQSENASLKDSITRREASIRAAQRAAEEALFTTRRGDSGPRKPS